MNRNFRNLRLPSFWLVALLACAVGGCRTLEYRDVQTDFERAVLEDNQRTPSPFIDWYRNVAESLTPDYVARLDQKLRPNAWMLRAVSQWRSGDLQGARESAGRGSKEPALAPGSRDDIVLTMIPGLVVDSELMREFKSAGSKVAAAQYQSLYGSGFKTAVEELDKARAKFKEPTPASVRHYWHYQRWRVLQNWSIVIAAIEPTAVDTRVEANAQAKRVLGEDLSAAILGEQNAIPADHPFRRLIELERSQ